MKRTRILFLGLLLIASIPAVASNRDKIIETYGINDLGAKPTFQGGYINFGYWKEIDLNKEQLTKEDRILASHKLYQLIHDELKVASTDSALEVGCGVGNGCIELYKKYHPQQIVGVDLTPQQIKRAYERHEDALKEAQTISFLNRSADRTGFPSDKFTKIYSVEAAQYFPSMDNFAKEAYRILKDRGRLVVTAHFATNENGYEKLKTLLPTVKEDVDRIIPIDWVREAFVNAGFKEIKFYSIGNQVFKGNDKWMQQVDDLPWVVNILKAYELGFMDYYVIVLEK